MDKKKSLYMNVCRKKITASGGGGGQWWKRRSGLIFGRYRGDRRCMGRDGGCVLERVCGCT